MSDPSRLTLADLHKLRRWNTPTIYNGWEQITRRNVGRDAFNLEPTTDFMPEKGPMAGYAVTLVIQPGEVRHRAANPEAWTQYRRYIASVPGPKIVVVQDLDKPSTYGSIWGEVNSGLHRALGCVGAIVDGAIRDLDEMRAAGFKALARRLCVGHAFSTPVRWGVPVEVFGTRVEPGQLIHADKHGFMAIPREDEARLLDAAIFMDNNECDTLIAAARDTAGLPVEQVLKQVEDAAARFGLAALEKFKREGEW